MRKIWESRKKIVEGTKKQKKFPGTKYKQWLRKENIISDFIIHINNDICLFTFLLHLLHWLESCTKKKEDKTAIERELWVQNEIKISSSKQRAIVLIWKQQQQQQWMQLICNKNKELYLSVHSFIHSCVYEGTFNWFVLHTNHAISLSIWIYLRRTKLRNENSLKSVSLLHAGEEKFTIVFIVT